MGKAYFKINGITYYPQSMKEEHESLATSDSGRTDDGVMHISFIKSNLRKLTIQMPPCDPSVQSTLMSAIQGNPNISVTYWDALTNSEITKSMYCSNSSTDWYSGVIMPNGIIKGWQFSLIDLGE